MHPNARLIDEFYLALGRGDGEFMASVYAPEATFEDPVFALRGEEIGDMWRMLCSASGAIDIVVSDVQADETRGRAHWEATYRFGPKQRRVHNSIDARFRFADGGIVAHLDCFSFHRWARQALGPAGLVLGGLPFFREKVRVEARARLESFRRR